MRPHPRIADRRRVCVRSISWLSCQYSDTCDSETYNLYCIWWENKRGERQKKKRWAWAAMDIGVYAIGDALVAMLLYMYAIPLRPTQYTEYLYVMLSFLLATHLQPSMRLSCSSLHQVRMAIWCEWARAHVFLRTFLLFVFKVVRVRSMFLILLGCCLSPVLWAIFLKPSNRLAADQCRKTVSHSFHTYGFG